MFAYSLRSAVELGVIQAWQQYASRRLPLIRNARPCRGRNGMARIRQIPNDATPCDGLLTEISDLAITTRTPHPSRPPWTRIIRFRLHREREGSVSRVGLLLHLS